MMPFSNTARASTLYPCSGKKTVSRSSSMPMTVPVPNSACSTVESMRIAPLPLSPAVPDDEASPGTSAGCADAASHRSHAPQCSGLSTPKYSRSARRRQRLVSAYPRMISMRDARILSSASSRARTALTASPADTVDTAQTPSGPETASSQATSWFSTRPMARTERPDSSAMSLARIGSSALRRRSHTPAMSARLVCPPAKKERSEKSSAR